MKAKVRGSATIEMVYCMSLFLLLFLLTVYSGFYFHDKNIVNGIAYEASVVAAGQLRQGAEAEVDMQPFIQERLRGKLLLLRYESNEIEREKHTVRIKIRASYKWMKTQAESCAVIPRPEEKIRKRRR